MMKSNKSIKVLHLSQSTKYSHRKIISKLCKLLGSNNSLKELYFEVEISKNNIEEFRKILETNMSLILWDSPGNLFLSNYIEANKKIEESIEKKSSLAITEEPSELQKILINKMRNIGPTQNDSHQRMMLKTIIEATMETDKTLKDEMEELYKAKSDKKWASKTLRIGLEKEGGKITAEELGKILINIFSHIENKLSDGNETKSIINKEADTKIRNLESRMEILERGTKKLKAFIQTTIDKKLREFKEEFLTCINANKYSNDTKNCMKVLENKFPNMEASFQNMKKDLYNELDSMNSKLKLMNRENNIQMKPKISKKSLEKNFDLKDLKSKHIKVDPLKIRDEHNKSISILNSRPNCIRDPVNTSYISKEGNSLNRTQIEGMNTSFNESFTATRMNPLDNMNLSHMRISPIKSIITKNKDKSH